MKPICNMGYAQGSCKNDPHALYLGNYYEISYGPYRRITSWFPRGWEGVSGPSKPFFPRPIPPNLSVLARACLWCVGARMWRANPPSYVNSITNSCLTPRIVFPSCHRPVRRHVRVHRHAARQLRQVQHAPQLAQLEAPQPVQPGLRLRQAQAGAGGARRAVRVQGRRVRVRAAPRE